MLKHVQQRLQAGEPVRIVLYGDSICEVGRTARYFGGASCAEANWGQQLGKLLRQAHPKATFDVAYFSIGGQNAYEGLGRLDWLGAMAPDLVLVSFGANDAGYHFLPPDATRLALRSLIDGVRAGYGADVVVVLPGGWNPLCPTWLHAEETFDAVRQAAADTQAPLADVRAMVQTVTDGGRLWTTYHNGVADCHPNDRGHAAWAGAVHATIEECLGVREARR